MKPLKVISPPSLSPESFSRPAIDLSRVLLPAKSRYYSSSSMCVERDCQQAWHKVPQAAQIGAGLQHWSVTACTQEGARQHVRKRTVVTCPLASEK